MLDSFKSASRKVTLAKFAKFQREVMTMYLCDNEVSLTTKRAALDLSLDLRKAFWGAPVELCSASAPAKAGTWPVTSGYPSPLQVTYE